MRTILTTALALAALGGQAQYSHTVQAERLGRGPVAVNIEKGGVFISWRSLVSDDPALTFDIYRNGTKLNESPLATKTNFTDPAGQSGDTYTVKALLDGKEVETTDGIKPWGALSMRIPMQRPEGGIFPGNSKHSTSKGSVTDEYEYTPNSVSVGDVDGDGEWEYIVKWSPTNHADNSFVWQTGKCYFDCYKADGTRLWRIDMGVNIRSGNHYTQFLVYDFDGDGKAEMMVKTAPGTIDGTGKPVIMGNDDPEANYMTEGKGTILKGPEYLTVFNGETGAEISTIAYNPPRNIRSDWGDSYGNRQERYLAGVAYLDGQRPSGVFCRGYYTHSFLWAVDFDGKELKERWLHASTEKGKGAYGEGAHSLTVGDVDGDGCDEIVYGSAVIDNDGSLLYRTGGGHGDALHMGDFLPEREGLEIFMVYEEKKLYDAAMRDARTGEVIFSETPPTKDNGRGVCANISSKYPGYEAWSQTNVMWAGQKAYTNLKVPDKNFRVYWDGDLLDELYEGKGDGPADAALKCNLTKVNNDITSVSTLIDFAKYGACHSYLTKRVPLLQADLFGDWREEMIFFDKNTSSDLLIFSTTIPTEYKVASLMQDRQYRLAAAWQNVAYHQPPHLSYNLEEKFATGAKITLKEGSLSQALYLGDAMQTVTFTVSKATGAEVTGLPDGVGFAFDAATLTGTISGTPATEGEHTYTITTTGAEGGADATVSGVLNVRVQAGLKLVGYFPFEKVGATTPNTVTGEAEARNGKAGSAEAGKVGNALALDGTACYLQPNYGDINFGLTPFTIEMWINSNSGSNCYILNKGVVSDADGSGNWVGLEYKNSELRFAVDDRKTKSEVKTGGASKYFDGAWHHIVMVRDTDSKSLTLYVDGEAVAQGGDATGAIENADEPLCIGNVNFSFNNPYNGKIDELCIYHGAMSAAQVQARYADPTYAVAAVDAVDAETGYARWTLVNAMNGMVVATAEGYDCFGITAGVPAGVYILVVEGETATKTYKFIKK